MQTGPSYNIILLGGTGAKCGEILIHMCASGYFPFGELRILYIDSDMDNGNAQRFLNVYNKYQMCRERYRIKKSGVPFFFWPQIELIQENPVMDAKYFKDLANKSSGEGYGSVDEVNAAKALMGALYSDEEIELNISEGFFAHPNVGAAVFSANMDTIMRRFLGRLESDRDVMRKIRVFLLGSVFGGTGAASLPTIARYLREKLYDLSDNKNIKEQLAIGGCMLLPYFTFKGREMEENGEKIEADKFAVKTRAAMEYYRYVDEEQGRKTFDQLYVLGHDGNDIRGKYATAGKEQRNLPHIVELYAASSAIDFFESSDRKKEREGLRYRFAVVPVDKIRGTDIYKSTAGYAYFFVMMRFSIVIKSLIMEELFDYKNQNKLKSKANRIPWYYDFLNGKKENKEIVPDKLYSYFEAISGYCSEYIRWFAELNLGNIEKAENWDEINYGSEKRNERVMVDTVPYLDMFSTRLLFCQHQNDLIWEGMDKIDGVSTDKIYQDNLNYIRENLQNLEKKQFFTDSEADEENRTMSHIWSFISEAGLNGGVKENAEFRNIVRTQDKSMVACVRNLVNAIYCACML